jgi:uncharacterized protein YcaQ
VDSHILTNKQARRFILLKQGLIGDYKFAGGQGVCDFVRQAGCIQFDPIDVCGKNSELVLQSRIKSFTKQMLYDLLYKDRKLIDYFDKNLAIISAEDWKHFQRIRDSYRRQVRSSDEIALVEEEIKSVIREKGFVSSKDVDFDKKVDWYWSETRLSRAALETMYFRGDLIIHHKSGTNKYYALAEDYLPEEILKAEDPHKTELEHLKWRALRRISAVGMLWNKPSDAWLYMSDFKADVRKAVFAELLAEGRIMELQVENIKDKLYCLSSDMELLDVVLADTRLKERTEFLAPLDNMLWDRRLLKEIFQFDYKWEIYTPESQRKYGYYVLPILSGDCFIGRAEIVNQKKEKLLLVKNIWLEHGVKETAKLKSALENCLNRFARFNGCDGWEPAVDQAISRQ